MLLLGFPSTCYKLILYPQPLRPNQTTWRREYDGKHLCKHDSIHFTPFYESNGSIYHHLWLVRGCVIEGVTNLINPHVHTISSDENYLSHWVD